MKYRVGEIIFGKGEITINEKKEVVSLIVNNRGDRSIQVCSHYHFFETNPVLEFERGKALGMRLDIPSGTAVRFEPGEDKKVNLVPYGGEQKVIGFRGMTMGVVTDAVVRKSALDAAEDLEKRGEEQCR